MIREYEIGDATVQIEMFLFDNGLGNTGQTVTVAARRVSDNFFLDFADDAFKSSGWTTKNQALTEITGVDELVGLYRFVWDSSTAITDYELLAWQFKFIDGADTFLDTEYVLFGQKQFAEKALVNRLEVNEGASELRVYEVDGTTLFKTFTLTDKDSLGIVLQGTGPSSRSTPF